jgi:3-deoxy-D-manno-octulosonate 8-phosphate phosphatase (KDO 8-P phosphatase)
LKSTRGKPAKAADIRLLVLDVDGVLTDGRLYYGPHGEALKVFHVRDGFGIRAVMDAGIEVAIISGRRSTMVARRCRDLGIKHVFQGDDAKLPILNRLLKRLKIAASECACVGDDIIDVPMLQAAGLAIAVRDAHPSALEAAHVATTLPGGRGAVREVCDGLLAARSGLNRRVSRRYSPGVRSANPVSPGRRP